MWTLKKRGRDIILFKNNVMIGDVEYIEKSNNENFMKIHTSDDTRILQLDKFDWLSNEYANNFKNSLSGRHKFLQKWMELNDKDGHDKKSQTSQSTQGKPGPSSIEQKELTSACSSTTKVNKAKPQVAKSKFKDTAASNSHKEPSMFEENLDKNNVTKIKRKASSAHQMKKQNIDQETGSPSTGKSVKQKASAFKNNDSQECREESENEPQVSSSFMKGIEKKFKGYYTLSVGDLVEPSHQRLVRKPDIGHVEELERCFRDKPSSYYTMMVVNVPGFDTLDEEMNDKYTFETIGGNHSRIALQNILSDESTKHNDFCERLCAVYCNLTPEECKRVGLDHNAIHKLGKDLNFFTRVTCFRSTLFQCAGMLHTNDFITKPTPTDKDIKNDWKRQICNITGATSRKDLNNKYRLDLSLAQLTTACWQQLSQFVLTFETTSKMSLSGRQMRIFDGLDESSLTSVLKEINTKKIDFREMKKKCQQIKGQNRTNAQKNEQEEDEPNACTSLEKEDNQLNDHEVSLEVKRLKQERDDALAQLRNKTTELKERDAELAQYKSELKKMTEKKQEYENTIADKKRKLANLHLENLQLTEKLKKKKKTDLVTEYAAEMVGPIELNPSPTKKLRVEGEVHEGEDQVEAGSKDIESNIEIPSNEYPENTKVTAMWKDKVWYDAIIKKKTKRDPDSVDSDPSTPPCKHEISSTTTTTQVTSIFTTSAQSTLETTTAEALEATMTRSTLTSTLELSTPYIPNEPPGSDGIETREANSTHTTQPSTSETQTPNKIFHEQSETSQTGLIIGVVSGSIVLILMICILGFIIRSRLIQKTENGQSNVYTDLFKKDKFKDSSTKQKEGPDSLQEYTTLNQVHVVPGTNQQTTTDFSYSAEYNVIQSSNSPIQKIAPSKDAANINDAFYAVLDPSETGFDRRTNKNNKQTPKDAANHTDAFYAVLDPSETGFDRKTNNENKPLHVPNEYLELDSNATGYNNKDKRNLPIDRQEGEYMENETAFQLDNTYELAEPIIFPVVQNNVEETDYACTNIKEENNDFRPNTDNIYSHTVDDVYDVSSHVRQTNDRDSSYGQFVS